jgi:hypothetical protein
MQTVDLESGTKDNWIVNKRVLLGIYIISLFLLGSKMLFAQSGMRCDGDGCGGPDGTSSCSASYSCQEELIGTDKFCNFAPGCLDNAGDACETAADCGPGYGCVYSVINGRMGCSPSPNSETENPTPGGGYAGEGAACFSSGCNDPICGKGYSCDNSICVQNSSCVGDVLKVPYEGPRIRSLATLIARFYNIMFPAALLIGVIMMIKGGYEIMTSEGNPQLAKAGQEDLTAAVVGSLFIVMSGMILRMIIVQILGGTVAF